MRQTRHNEVNANAHVAPSAVETVSMPMTRDTQRWMDALLRKGLCVVDDSYCSSFDPRVGQLIDALHEVLAGGEVSVRVEAKGSASVKADLDRKMRAAILSSNELSKLLGEPLTP